MGLEKQHGNQCAIFKAMVNPSMHTPDKAHCVPG